MSDFLKLVGNKVRSVRKVKGFTQEELAEKCGLQYTYIGGIERGERNVSLQTVEKLADGLEVAPYELLKFDDLEFEDIFNEKRLLTEVNKSLFLTRNEKEVKTLHKIITEILELIDSERNSNS